MNVLFSMDGEDEMGGEVRVEDAARPQPGPWSTSVSGVVPGQQRASEAKATQGRISTGVPLGLAYYPMLTRLCAWQARSRTIKVAGCIQP